MSSYGSPYYTSGTTAPTVSMTTGPDGAVHRNVHFPGPNGPGQIQIGSNQPGTAIFPSAPPPPAIPRPAPCQAQSSNPANISHKSVLKENNGSVTDFEHYKDGSHKGTTKRQDGNVSSITIRFIEGCYSVTTYHEDRSVTEAMYSKDNACLSQCTFASQSGRQAGIVW